MMATEKKEEAEVIREESGASWMFVWFRQLPVSGGKSLGFRFFRAIHNKQSMRNLLMLILRATRNGTSK